ncbi:protein kinase domain-containing protein [Rubritalea tangerina]|uniref:Protein kinase n=1 Tax=Rubritalea tangerina TaxID=430798 RepID=A0ABW4Z945_9BACT
MSDQSLSSDALLKAFQQAAEKFSEVESLTQKMTTPRYHDKEPIAEGGAKRIYLSQDSWTQREVARAFPKTPQTHDEFIREALLHAQLEHPNIIPLYDLGVDEKVPYFCMKLIQGQTLENYVKLNTSSLNQAEQRDTLIDIFVKVCDAVAFAHANQVLHLDLKPANIQLSDHGEVLVGDWGLARAHAVNDETFVEQNQGQFTRHGYLSGTPGFMAPEQCTKGSEKDIRTDIYSLGALLVFILTGKPPVTGSTEQMMLATKEAKLDSLSQDIPEALRAISLKALSQDPNHRYSNVDGLLADIKAFRSGYLTTAENVSTLKLLKALYRRNQKTLISALVILIIFTLLTLLFIYRLTHSENLAQFHQNQAETTLLQYQRAQAEKEQQGVAFANDYLKESISYYYDGTRGRHDYITRRDERAYQLVTKALELDPSNEEAWALKGRLSMLTFRLDVAEKAFERAGQQYLTHLDVCRSFKNSDLTDLDQLSNMLWQLVPTQDNRLIHDFMFLTIFTKRNDSKLISFIEESLNMRNPSPTGRLHFHYDKKSQSLDLSDNPEMTFIFMIKNLPLRHLNLANTKIGSDLYHIEKMPLVELDVSNTLITNARMQHLRGKPLRKLALRSCSITKLDALADLPIETLDIRGCQIKNFTALQKLEELKQLICTPAQAEQIKKALPNMPKQKLVLKNETNT